MSPRRPFNRDGSPARIYELEGLLARLAAWEDESNTSSLAVLYRRLCEDATPAPQRPSTTNAGGLGYGHLDR